ncbi:zona pellucida sperm-binding protein 4-like [Mobula hypostoma]|uniref:zona pellucida sperm-binding protein 4-like n=1 Tax=Mobula hypostoma TaxID=723540 RepID=UPI002FC3B844
MSGLWVLGLSLFAFCSVQPPSVALPANKCWLSPRFRKVCGFEGISGRQCVLRGCCFEEGNIDVPACFHSLDNIPKCTEDGRVLVAISKDLTLPPVNLSTVYVTSGTGTGAEAECRPTAVSAHAVLFQFALTKCGTTQRVDGGKVVYETDVLGQFEILGGAFGSVSRDSTFRLHVRCSYQGDQKSDLEVTPRVYTLSPPPPATAIGPLLLELRIARDGGYRRWYAARDYPIVSVLRDPVFVEVRVLNRNDPSLVLVLNECWATPGPEPHSDLRWDLLVDRCPFAGDNYKTRLVPVDAASHLRFPTHHQRFVVNTFAFWDRLSTRALSGEVYFHCSAEVCSPPAPENCMAPCGHKKRRSAYERAGVLMAAAGPIILQDEERLSTEHRQGDGDAAVDSPSWVIPGVAAGAALLSVSLLIGTVALWYQETGDRAGPVGKSIEL